MWYVPGNGRIAGVITLYWAVSSCVLWIPLKRPQLAPMGIFIMITITPQMLLPPPSNLTIRHLD